MKFLSFNKWAVTLLCATSQTSAVSHAKSLRNNNVVQPSAPNNDLQHRVLQEGEETGTFLIGDIQYEESTRRQLNNGNGVGNGNPHHTVNIETASGAIYELTNVNPAWLKGKGKDLSSGVSKIKIGKGASITDKGKIDLKGGNPEEVGGAKNLFQRALEEGDNEVTTEEQYQQYLRRSELRRQLQTSRTLGNRSVLAVRVIANDGQYGFDETTLSNEVFGNGVDPFNLVSQYNDCSYGRLTFRKATEKSGTSTSIANGVVTIQVAKNTTEGDSIMRNAITAELNAQFGVTSPNQLADHVMYCLPTGTMTGIAYAYVNSWNSVYSNQWCNYPSGQMHEIGHNLGFGHSNEGTTEYADQSGMMGYSYSQDDGPKMCFNSAKSFQSGWYQEGVQVVTPFAATNNCFVGRIYGIADFAYQVSNRLVVIKINVSNSATDYYVNFNRQTSFNSGTREAGNQVLVTTAAGEGTAYAASTLLAKLPNLGSAQILNFGGTTTTVTITVDAINTSVSPGYADIRISYPGSTCDPITPSPTANPTPPPTANPTKAPTNAPTPSPTPSPTTSPTTSASPSESPTSAPTDSPTKSPTLAPTNAPTPQPTSAPTKSPTLAPTNAPTTPPTFEPTKSPTLAPTNSPTAPPTFAPTKSPIPAPTNAPTAQPTSAPTKSPTLSPTNAPTTPPTPAPTASPTPLPTNAPTAPPTPAPTFSPTPLPNCNQLSAVQCVSFSHCVVARNVCVDPLTCKAGGVRCAASGECCSGNCKGNGRCG